MVSPSDDPAVKEVITNPNWPAYPTDKLVNMYRHMKKGILITKKNLKQYLVSSDLQQENSIVLRVNNNGSAKMQLPLSHRWIKNRNTV